MISCIVPKTNNSIFSILYHHSDPEQFHGNKH